MIPTWSFEEAMCTFRERVVSLLRGDAWKGDGL